MHNNLTEQQSKFLAEIQRAFEMLNSPVQKTGGLLDIAGIIEETEKKQNRIQEINAMNKACEQLMQETIQKDIVALNEELRALNLMAASSLIEYKNSKSCNTIYIQPNQQAKDDYDYIKIIYRNDLHTSEFDKYNITNKSISEMSEKSDKTKSFNKSYKMTDLLSSNTSTYKVTDS